LGRVPEAIVVSRKAIELDPLSSNPWGQLGRMLNAVGQFAAARDALDRCLEISPESNRGLFHRGMTELLQGRPGCGDAVLPQSQQRLWRRRPCHGGAFARQRAGPRSASSMQ
jgi:Flp pilus assembly protein TadD